MEKVLCIWYVFQYNFVQYVEEKVTKKAIITSQNLFYKANSQHR